MKENRGRGCWRMGPGINQELLLKNEYLEAEKRICGHSCHPA
jgi:hypothetical protein